MTELKHLPDQMLNETNEFYCTFNDAVFLLHHFQFDDAAVMDGVLEQQSFLTKL